MKKYTDFFISDEKINGTMKRISFIRSLLKGLWRRYGFFITNEKIKGTMKRISFIRPYEEESVDSSYLIEKSKNEHPAQHLCGDENVLHCSHGSH